jgi:uncharacterized cupin superfamily protein
MQETMAMSAPSPAAIRINPADCPPPAPGKSTASTTAYADPSGRLSCGVWTSAPGRLDVTYRRNEFCLLLEGEVHLTDAAGRIEIFREGDAFVIPAGFVGVWEMPRPVRKYYVLHDPG